MVKIVPIGKLRVNLRYSKLITKLDLYVIKKGVHPLLERDWLNFGDKYLF